MADVTEYEITVDDAEEQRMQAAGDAWIELSTVIDYPPFSLYRDKLMNLKTAMDEAAQEIANAVAKTGITPENPYASVREKFADDIDEAMMYQKRYGNDFQAAQEAAMKIDKIDANYPGITKWPE